MNAQIKNVVNEALNTKRWRTRLVFWSAAAGLGVLAVGFASLCEWAVAQFMGAYDRSPWLPFLICPLGFWLARRLQDRFFPEASGSGIPQVMAALKTRNNALRERLLHLRVLVGKIFVTFLNLLFGGSVGREGPSVHIGAALFHSLGHYASFSKFERKQGLVVAGASAGIAAAFNAPLAGIVFAIEELKGSFEERSSGLMLSAVILSGLVALAIVGHYSFFGEVDGQLYGTESIIAVILIAIFCGAIGGGFARSILYLVPRINESIFRSSKKHRAHLWPIGLGLLVASIGWLSLGQSFGSGHHQTIQMLQNPETADPFFGFYKLAATFVSYLTGLAGGIFAPSLSIGAGLGHFVGQAFSDEVSLRALMLVGMVAYLSGITRAPVTSFVIVFEMTINHHMLLPLMAAGFVSSGVSRLVCEKSFYRGLCEYYLQPRKPIRLDTNDDETTSNSKPD